MCGIAGIVGVPRAVAERRVRAALASLLHRGPDGEGWYISDEAVLGMQRLAIIDVEHGNQPVYNEDRTVAVICNGELYNYVEGLAELRRRGHRFQSRSDVNLIPHYYEELGVSAFTRLRGMFACAIWDAHRRRLTLARDRVGKKPLFYAHVDGGIAFASELPALLALLEKVPDHDPVALADYLQLGFIPHPETVYEGVFSLTPGCVLTVDLGGMPRVEPYWLPHRPAPFTGTRDDALEAIDAALEDAVRLRLRSDVPVGLFLSGGIDSGLIASYAARIGAGDLLCFVVEVSDARLNEAPAAELSARQLGLPIQRIRLETAPLEALEGVALRYGQPFGDSSAIPSYFVARAASGHRKVVLNGDGGDEVFAGYRRYWAAWAAPWLVPTTRWLRLPLRQIAPRLARATDRRSALGFAGRILRGLTAKDRDRYLTWSVDSFDDATLARCFPDLARSRDPMGAHLQDLRGAGFGCRGLRQSQQSDYRLLLADGLVTKMDIATMANSLEARSPLLDVPLTELAWSLPEHWLISPRETKPLLRSLAVRTLPAQVVKAPKRGFEVPVARWLKTDLKEVLSDLLLATDSRVAELGDPAHLRRFIRSEDDFLGNRPQAIWCLLMLELFLRTPPSLPTA